ncbi:hypothetical protein GALMADRAFT_1325874 [Galerina marginata CBS 339.88]|uniref:Uncharacterized protein n=1 Tax=Galerina marginata (strain CBS 339.88) TaxID=685588 RepID=A0A067U3P1_GALM3|nr:hypothetical protein GALMADRAFT_1325874 [Galerina marginata CBS 339.88]
MSFRFIVKTIKTTRIGSEPSAAPAAHAPPTSNGIPTSTSGWDPAQPRPRPRLHRYHSKQTTWYTERNPEQALGCGILIGRNSRNAGDAVARSSKPATAQIIDFGRLSYLPAELGGARSSASIRIRHFLSPGRVVPEPRDTLGPHFGRPCPVASLLRPPSPFAGRTLVTPSEANITYLGPQPSSFEHQKANRPATAVVDLGSVLDSFFSILDYPRFISFLNIISSSGSILVERFSFSALYFLLHPPSTCLQFHYFLLHVEAYGHFRL